jgi:hypothetical protein
MGARQSGTLFTPLSVVALAAIEAGACHSAGAPADRPAEEQLGNLWTMARQHPRNDAAL